MGAQRLLTQPGQTSLGTTFFARDAASRSPRAPTPVPRVAYPSAPSCGRSSSCIPTATVRGTTSDATNLFNGRARRIDVQLGAENCEVLDEVGIRGWFTPDFFARSPRSKKAQLLRWRAGPIRTADHRIRRAKKRSSRLTTRAQRSRAIRGRGENTGYSPRSVPAPTAGDQAIEPDRGWASRKEALRMLSMHDLRIDVVDFAELGTPDAS
jgi:hypothetical protein